MALKMWDYVAHSSPETDQTFWRYMQWSPAQHRVLIIILSEQYLYMYVYIIIHDTFKTSEQSNETELSASTVLFVKLISVQFIFIALITD